MVFSFTERALASADFSLCNRLTVNGNDTFERKQQQQNKNAMGVESNQAR